jgi:hypothetical protein
MDNSTERWAALTRMLFRVALLVFAVTALIGIFNAFHFVKLSREVLLTHVHSGTLGWITLSAFATALWLFATSSRPGDGHPRGVSMGMAVMVPLYVLAFLSGNYVAKAVAGSLVLLLIVGLAVFLLLHISSPGSSVPRLGTLLAFTTLVIGSTLGVLIQVQGAINHSFMPSGAIGGHASAQVGGYLVLLALSIIDWRLKKTEGMEIAGVIQVVILFLSGVCLAAGVLLEIQPLLGLYIPLEIIALVIFLVRLGSRIIGASWGEATSERHYAIASLWIIVNLALTIYVVQLAIREGFNHVPFNVLVGADHAIFIGVMTNVFFGLIQDFTAEQKALMPWAENVIFYVMNLALAGFVFSLVTDQQGLEKFFAPFQGLAVLLAIVVYSMRLAALSPTLTSTPRQNAT